MRRAMFPRPARPAPAAPPPGRRFPGWRIPRLRIGGREVGPRATAAVAALVGALIVAVVAVAVTSTGGGPHGTAVALDPARGLGASALQASGGRGSAGSGAAARDVAHLLVAPAGFVALRPDAISGPLRQPDDLRRVLPDETMDPAAVVTLGLEQGYARGWRAAQTVTDPYGAHLPQPTIMTAAVLRFSSADAASSALRLLREHSRRGGDREFAVPTAGGFGTYRRVASTAQQHRYGVLWTRGTDLFDLAISYPQPASPGQVIGFATAQDRAVGG